MRVKMRSHTPMRARVGGDEAAHLGEQGEQRHLAQERRFAGHVGAGEHDDALDGVEAAVVGDEATGAERVLDKRVASLVDVDDSGVSTSGRTQPCPAATTASERCTSMMATAAAASSSTAAWPATSRAELAEKLSSRASARSRAPRTTALALLELARDIALGADQRSVCGGSRRARRRGARWEPRGSSRRRGCNPPSGSRSPLRCALRGLQPGDPGPRVRSPEPPAHQARRPRRGGCSPRRAHWPGGSLTRSRRSLEDSASGATQRAEAALSSPERTPERMSCTAGSAAQAWRTAASSRAPALPWTQRATRRSRSRTATERLAKGVAHARLFHEHGDGVVAREDEERLGERLEEAGAEQPSSHRGAGAVEQGREGQAPPPSATTSSRLRRVWASRRMVAFSLRRRTWTKPGAQHQACPLAVAEDGAGGADRSVEALDPEAVERAGAGDGEEPIAAARGVEEGRAGGRCARRPRAARRAARRRRRPGAARRRRAVRTPRAAPRTLDRRQPWPARSSPLAASKAAMPVRPRAGCGWQRSGPRAARRGTQTR